MCKQHTSSGVHPVNRHRRLEQALIRLELLEGISGASSICDDTASLSRSKIFKDAGQLVGSGSGLLYVYMTHASVNVLSSKLRSCIQLLFHIPRVKSVLSNLLCLEWSPAWSMVAVSVAFAAVCFKRVWARIEAGDLGWWKSVMTSFLADWYSKIQSVLFS